MIYLRKASEHGHTNHGWLGLQHALSFANYYGSNSIGFSVLRMISDSVIEAGQGFGTHPHRDMEILTYVLEGTTEHRDSVGSKEQVSMGEFRIVGAGTDIRHSEYNPNSTGRLYLYQVWTMSEENGIMPCYRQCRFDVAQDKRLVFSPDVRDGSLKVHQDMELYRRALLKDKQSVHQTAARRCVWTQVVKGNVATNGVKTSISGGLIIWDEQTTSIHADSDNEVLLSDLPLVQSPAASLKPVFLQASSLAPIAC